MITIIYLVKPSCLREAEAIVDDHFYSLHLDYLKRAWERRYSRSDPFEPDFYWGP